MNCINFCAIYKYCLKQLTIFEGTEVAASDFKTVQWSTVTYMHSIYPPKKMHVQVGNTSLLIYCRSIGLKKIN